VASKPRRLLLFPPFRLDPVNAQFWRGDQPIGVRPKTFGVLQYLVDHAGQLVTKAMLLDAVWPDLAVSDTMPATCVAELRRILDDDPKQPRFIETVHRRGYRFITPVTLVADRDPSEIVRTKAGPGTMLVGREEELAQLQRWYSEVLEGSRRVIFITGEAGIGKTAWSMSSSAQLKPSEPLA